MNCKTCKHYNPDSGEGVGPCQIVADAFDRDGFFSDAYGTLAEPVYLDEELGCSNWKKKAMKYEIGTKVTDETGIYHGVVCIVWDDGDICSIENDAAHPNPVVEENEALITDNSGETWTAR